MPTNAELEKRVEAMEAKTDMLHRALWAVTHGGGVNEATLPRPPIAPEILEHEAKRRGLTVEDYLERAKRGMI